MRWTYEDACKVSEIVTGDTLRSLGVEETMRLYREALEPSGWTLGELLEESARRMQEKISDLRAEEELRGHAGDRCEGGNNCGRLGCPECQQ